LIAVDHRNLVGEYTRRTAQECSGRERFEGNGRLMHNYLI
jgi:hypothetical protein